MGVITTTVNPRRLAGPLRESSTPAAAVIRVSQVNCVRSPVPAERCRRFVMLRPEAQPDPDEGFPSRPGSQVGQGTDGSISLHRPSISHHKRSGNSPIPSDTLRAGSHPPPLISQAIPRISPKIRSPREALGKLPEVVGSNPAPATNTRPVSKRFDTGLFCLPADRSENIAHRIRAGAILGGGPRWSPPTGDVVSWRTDARRREGGRG